jgi:hypothetical protein
MKVRGGVAINGGRGNASSRFRVAWREAFDLGAVCFERGTHGSAEGGVS